MPHTLVVVMLPSWWCWRCRGSCLRRVRAGERADERGHAHSHRGGTYRQVPKCARAADGLESPIKGFLDAALLICFLLVIGELRHLPGDAAPSSSASGASPTRSPRAVSARPADPGADGGLLARRIDLRMAEEVIPFVIIFIRWRAAWATTPSSASRSVPRAAAGFRAAFFNPFTVGIAQSIPVCLCTRPRLPPGDVGRRTAVMIAWVVRYARRVKRTPRSARARHRPRARGGGPGWTGPVAGTPVTPPH